MTNESETKRFFKRFALEIPVEFKRCELLSDEYFSGVLSDLTYAGARLATKNGLRVGEEIHLFINNSSNRQWINNTAKVVWEKSLGVGIQKEYGVRFVEVNPAFSKTLHYLIDTKIKPFRAGGAIVGSLVLLFLGLPTILVLGGMYSPAHGKNLFSLFMIVLCSERIWETFYTSKERDVFTTTEDWSLAAVTMYYIVMILGVTVEFYVIHRPIAIAVSLTGIAFLALSFCLRWWGMRTLGHQWAIHAVGNSKLSAQEYSLLRRGPYRIVRHPIYLAAILEVLAVPLIVNSYYMLGFVLLVNCPLMYLRSQLEEQTLFNRYFDEFVDYKAETGRFLPNIKKPKGGKRRQQSLYVDFPDRRSKGAMARKQQ